MARKFDRRESFPRVNRNAVSSGHFVAFRSRNRRSPTSRQTESDPSRRSGPATTSLAHAVAGSIEQLEGDVVFPVRIHRLGLRG
jgi:hypothetical protein